MCKCERVWDYAREWKFQINMFHTFLRWLAIIGGPFGSGMMKVLKVEVQLFLPVRIKTVSLNFVFVVYIAIYSILLGFQLSAYYLISVYVWSICLLSYCGLWNYKIYYNSSFKKILSEYCTILLEFLKKKY